MLTLQPGFTTNAMYKSILGFVTALCFTGVQADTLYTQGDTDQMESPYSFKAGFNAAAGDGLVSARLKGHNSLDGNNFHADAFRVPVNGSAIFTGTFGFGGWGDDLVALKPEDTAFNRHDGVVDLVSPVSLFEGRNLRTFAYSGLDWFAHDEHFGLEGLGNEGWDFTTTEVTGIEVSRIPEPETYALLLASLGAFLFMAHRRWGAR